MIVELRPLISSKVRNKNKLKGSEEGPKLP